MNKEDKKIQKFQSKAYCKIINHLHKILDAPNRDRCLWVYVCNIREEYLKFLESL